MARKLLNRKELREENEAAEQLEGQKKAAATAPKKTTAKKKTTRAKPRSKASKEVRLKAFWGVYNQSLRQVGELFEYSERKQAEKKAKQLSESAKTPHFVQVFKKVIEE